MKKDKGFEKVKKKILGMIEKTTTHEELVEATTKLFVTILVSNAIADKILSEAKEKKQE